MTAPRPTIRPATADDLPAITAIYADAVLHGTASWETEPPDEAEMGRRMRTVAEADHPYLAALDEAGRLLGYAYCGPYRPRAAYRWTVENSIYVDPSAHGRGVGRALLQGLVEESARRGFRQMMAVIGDSANAASIGLHRSLGFELVGIARAVGFKHGRWLDQVLMQRALGAGGGTPPG
ncbi:GNAT family N-acetyltransferase [Chthonobacter rhizosphaerae]|uniref:GNAT family N-acetyltransferase n=1 Tax=Chthonobacter rhizosphaerae TaxID=2735553 RepID=UPI0015EEE37A|nr:GNAT family N-acetyltransferase [Chthonobacter rhizosphaerae]